MNVKTSYFIFDTLPAIDKSQIDGLRKIIYGIYMIMYIFQKTQSLKNDETRNGRTTNRFG